MKTRQKFKVIFLDLDGVVSPLKKHVPKSEDHFPVDVEFSPKAIKNLKKLLQESGAKIVISSRWLSRTNVQAVMLVLASHGITGPFVLPEDVNKKENVNQSDWFSSNSHVFYGYSVTPKKMSSEKCNEIAFWISDYGSFIDGFVVLDDDYISGFDEYQVQTNRSKGLSEKDVSAALEILNKGMSPFYNRRRKEKQEHEQRMNEIFNRNKKEG